MRDLRANDYAVEGDLGGECVLPVFEDGKIVLKFSDCTVLSTPVTGKSWKLCNVNIIQSGTPDGGFVDIRGNAWMPRKASKGVVCRAGIRGVLVGNGDRIFHLELTFASQSAYYVPVPPPAAAPG